MNDEFTQQISDEVDRIAQLELGEQPDEFNRLRELLEAELDAKKTN
jgi:hypothetical protein